MTLVRSVGQSIPVVVRTPQPTRPPTSPPPNIGLVEIAKIETAETPESILAKLLTVDGAGSGLDADMLDGQHGKYYVDLANSTGNLPPSSLVPADVLTALKTVDGAGSGLDADLLDGQHGAYYATASGLAANDARDNTQDTRLTNVEGRVTATENVNATQDTRLNGIDTLNTTQNNRLTAIEGVNTTQDNRLGSIETVNNAQDAQIALRLTDAPNDGLTYGRRSQLWATIVGGAVISDTPPGPPLQAGQLWWDSSSGRLFLWYVDVNSSQWVQVNSTASLQAKLPIARAYGTSTTWNKPPGCLWIDLEGCGAGAAGGGIQCAVVSIAHCGGGGAAGGSGIVRGIDVSGYSSATITIGAGGANVLGAPGGNGGDTIVVLGSTTYTFGGGAGGFGYNAGSNNLPSAANGGAGGNVSGPANLFGGGQPGGSGVSQGGNNPGVSGQGGSSPFGTGGAAVRYNGGTQSSNGNSGSGYGSGGSGGLVGNIAGGNVPGGGGTGGIVRITEHYG
jgi:hypothetical protein